MKYFLSALMLERRSFPTISSVPYFAAFVVVVCSALISLSAFAQNVDHRSLPDQGNIPTVKDNSTVSVPGTNPNPGVVQKNGSFQKTGPSSIASVSGFANETGFISLSVDGLGTNGASGIIQVEKPAGATVRKAYMAAASTGFSGRLLATGDVTIDGNGVVWNLISNLPSSISSYNSLADVTSMVKPKIDAAAAGRVNFTITEVGTGGIDGEILAVIFDDPNQTTSNTVILLFGAANILGDDFYIGLANPVDLLDPNLKLDFGLGISFGAQPGPQVSLIDVNGTRMSSSAGGEDDGSHANGALLTVGGLDDSNGNPPPFAAPTSASVPDDEMYNLIPFVPNNSTSIHIHSVNPSHDDNIFFSWLFLANQAAVVGEGILLSPLTASNQVCVSHTVTATVQDANGQPIQGRQVDFEVVSGPNMGVTGSANTNANGQATFTYNGSPFPGTDAIVARMTDSQSQLVTSNTVNKVWINTPPTALCKDISVPLVGGTVTVLPGDVDNGSYDDCGIASMSVSPNTFDCSQIGPHSVTLTVTDNSGSSSTCTATVTVDGAIPTPTIAVTPSPTVSPGGDPLTIYIGYGPQTVNLAVSGGVAWSWSSVPSGFTSSVQNPNVSPTVTTTYSVLVTNSYGCTATASVTIQVIDIRCGNYLDKVTICHYASSQANTLCIAPSAVPAHLALHGDHLGPCPVPRPEPNIVGLPGEFTLDQNFPNPFNGTTIIGYSLPEETHVTLRVFDLYGREVLRLVSGVQHAGFYNASVNAKDLPAGTYLYKLEVNNSTLTKVMTLMR